MIEILAVFTMTAIILLITVPFITNMVKQGDKKAKESFINDVYIATDAYVQADKMVVTEEVSTIKIKDLLESGYLRSNLINPENNKELKDSDNLDKEIKVYKDEEGILQYEMDWLDENN